MMDYMKLNDCYRPLPEELSSQAILDITKIGPDVLSKQVTLIELSLFKAIQREEFASLKWNGKEKHLFAPNIVASTRWFNQTNFWVQREILRHAQLSKRSEMLSFFIKMAKKLVDHNNLCSAMAVVSALQVECIYRLRHTWDGLNGKDRAAYRRLEDLFSQDNNCRQQREHMDSVFLPGIPYLGVYLSDLTYANLAHPRIGGKPTATWLSKINAIIDTIAYFQQSEYPFVMDETVNAYLCAQRYIEELQKFIEEDNYRTSLRLEPPPQSPVDASFPFCSPFEKRCATAQAAKYGSHSPCHLKIPLKNPVNRKPGKSAVDNSSFECDASLSAKVTYVDGKLEKRSPSNASTSRRFPSPNQFAEPSTPIVQIKREPQNEVDISSHGNTEHETTKQHSCGDSIKHNPGVTSVGTVNQNCSDTLHNDELTHRGHTDNMVNQLPPIPPRPFTETNLKLPSGSVNSPAVLPNEGRMSLSVSQKSICLRDGRLDSVISGISSSAQIDQNDSSVGILPETKSLSVAHSIPTQSPFDCLTDSTAAAIGVAIVAKGFLNLCHTDHPSLSPQRRLSYAPDLHDDSSMHGKPLPLTSTYSANDQSQSVRHYRSASTPTTLPICRPPPACNFGVVVLFQGALQRRTITCFARNKTHILSALLSPKIRKNSVTSKHDSASSIPAPPYPNEAFKGTLTVSRPAGFSTWRRLWATLVLVGNGSAAFMIYFEAKSKTASLRCDFKDHQCQVQNLMNLSFCTKRQHCLPDETVTSSGGARGHSSSSLNAFLNPDHWASLDRSCSSLRAVSRTCAHDITAHVDVGKHRDGSIDPHSFVLSDPNTGKVYQFRPIIQPDVSRSSRNLSWLRRTIVHTGHAKADSMNLSSPVNTESDDRASVVQPVQDPPTSSPLDYPLSSCNPVDYGNPLLSSKVNEWIRSLQLVVNQLQCFYQQ